MWPTLALSSRGQKRVILAESSRRPSSNLLAAEYFMRRLLTSRTDGLRERDLILFVQSALQEPAAKRDFFTPRSHMAAILVV